MKRKIWNRYTTALISIIGLFFAYEITIACTDYIEGDIKDESLFAPEISGQDSLSPFFLSYHLLYGVIEHQNNNSYDSTNHKEWYKYYDGKIDSVSLDWLLYKSSKNEIDELMNGIAHSSEAKQALIKTHDISFKKFLEYLLLSKRFEDFSNNSYYSWGEVNEVDSSLLISQPRTFELKWKKEENTFYKDRYAYQWIRALFYCGEYEGCVSTFNLCFPEFKNSSIYYRALSYKCGSLKQSKKYLESNLVAADLYLKSREGRINAYYDFTLQSKDKIELTARFTNDIKTKCSLWHLYGIYGSPLEGMKNIYAIDPSSDLLILPLMRAVNIVELELLKNPYYSNEFISNYELENRGFDKGESGINLENKSSNYSWKSLRNQASDSLITFISFALENPSLYQPNIFKTSLAYLHYLKGNDVLAEKLIEEVNSDLSAKPIIKNQNYTTTALIYLRKVLSKNTLTNQEEIAICRYMQSFEENSGLNFPRKTNTLRYFKLLLSQYYKNNSNSIMSELAVSDESDFYNQSGNIDNMISFLEQSSHSPVENYLIKNYTYQLVDFYELNGNIKLYEYDFANAVKEYQKAIEAGARKLNANPFFIRINDCHDCDYNPNMTLTKLQFAKEMLSTQNAINTIVSDEERAKLCFKLANGLYNMTYYGNNRVIAQSDFSEINYPYGSTYYRWNNESKTSLDELSSYYDCREAQKYYNMAEQFSINREFKAKCVWMAAKCEHNVYLETGFPGNRKNIDFIAGKNFKRLKTEFNNTLYFKEIINECGYFCTYNRGYNCKGK